MLDFRWSRCGLCGVFVVIDVLAPRYGREQRDLFTSNEKKGSELEVSRCFISLALGKRFLHL